MTAGPVSQALRAELLGEVRRQGIVVWLDKDANYTGFVDRLVEQHGAGDFPYPVIGFRGSFIETLFALEAYGSGYEKHSLVVHMPGFNEDAIRATPVLELYAAGTRFRKALDTLVRQAATGRVLPEEVEAFLRESPTLEKADEWLAQAVSKRTVGLEALLDSSGPTLIVEALGNKGGPLVSRVTTDEEAGALRSYLHKLTGMDDEWFRKTRGDTWRSSLEQVLNAFSAWVLCVEYVHDLRRKPYLSILEPLTALSRPLVEASKGIVVRLRGHYPEAYAGLAHATEAIVISELDRMAPEDLGQIDTFRKEADRVLDGVTEALAKCDWERAAAWAKARRSGMSFWLEQDPRHRRAWEIVAEAAAFGTLLTLHPRPFAGLRHFEDALTRYAEGAALVDRAHRRFEQEWLRHLDPDVPHYGALQEVLGSLRQLHRTWIDQLTRDFTLLCRAEGFLPAPELQQRTVYEQVVQPMAFGGEKVAVFLLDAFRYEMATELVEDLRATGGGAIVDLKARFAELPTITSVGMNALAPVAQNGRLTVTGVLQGFKSGEVSVRSPGDRAKAMGIRTSGKPGLRLTLSELCDSSAEGLKRKVKEHQLVVVCSSEIDDAGEANVGLLTFEAQLRQIKAAWHHLQTAGIKHAVFTADHGFLLQDSTTEVHTFGKKTDPHPRYVLDEHDRAEAGMVPVPLAKLGYDGLSGYLLLREDTAVYRTGTVGASFVHGGNSPQERIIPVLTVTRKRAESASLSEYAVEATVMAAAFGFHRLQVRLRYAQQTLGFVGARGIDLDLRVPERRDIRVMVKEVTGAGSLKSGRIHAPVGDAWTEVYFSLEGATDERVRVEVHHGDNIEKVRPCVPDALFAVSGLSGGARPPTAPPPAPSWAENIEDEAIRTVFLHLEKHGAATEVEIIKMLGTARAARRFALNFDGFLTKLPFRVRSESNASGKRYVREEEK